MLHGRIFQFDPKVVRAHEARWIVSAQGGGYVKLERSPGWNMARAEQFCFEFMHLLNKSEMIKRLTIGLIRSLIYIMILHWSRQYQV